MHNKVIAISERRLRREEAFTNNHPSEISVPQHAR